MSLDISRQEGSEPVYDANEGFVVRAESETQARNIASDHHADEGMRVWLTDAVICEEILSDGEPGVILQSFNAG